MVNFEPEWEQSSDLAVPGTVPRNVQLFYVYHLSENELNLTRFDFKEATDMFGKNTVEFCECMLARQKFWANLCATDWPQYVKIREVEGERLLQPYETQESCHEAAVNGIIMWENRLRHAREARANKKSKKKVKAGEV